MKFEADVRAQGTEIEVVARGILTEAADLSALLGQIAQAKQSLPAAGAVPRIAFDMGGISRTNSVGIREWLLFLEKLPPGTPLLYRKLSPMMVEQANVIPNMLGKGKVTIESFQAPYVCPDCGELTTPVLEVGKLAREGGKIKAPAQTCPKCKKPMELDWSEDEYFRFLSARSG